MIREVNFDGLVGPTHSYAGLSYGNVASAIHQGQSSSPREAALQGLAKMRFVASLGVPQAVLPPLPRPRLSLLRHLGFQGSPKKMIDDAWRTDPALVGVCFSASNMWTANAATVSPSADTIDHLVHLTPANLATLLHRTIEADQTRAMLAAIFENPTHFRVYPPLLGSQALSDEGAANHTRLSGDGDSGGIEVFVYGRSALAKEGRQPQRFPARQTREACEAIARRHGLDAQDTFFVQQHPDAIDAGVFHNDVISVGVGRVLLLHASAYLEQNRFCDALRGRFEARTGQELIIVEVTDRELALKDTVASYLFNSVLLRLDADDYRLICPGECETNSAARAVVDRILSDASNPIQSACFMDLRQSMNNGGGPACLRLRVPLNDSEFAAVHDGVKWTPELDQQLTGWVERYYRETLAPDDLRDPALIEESVAAASELARILQLPPTLFLDRDWM
jgi:succinylarginine dihydrolase